MFRGSFVFLIRSISTYIYAHIFRISATPTALDVP